MSDSRPYDPGLVPGSFAVALVLALWGYSYYQEGHSGALAAEPEPPAAGSQAEAPPPLPAVVLTIPDGPAVPVWETDERWERAVPQGDAALARMVEERKRHEKEGDPFRYRYVMGQVADELQAAIAVLNGMLEDYAGNQGAEQAIRDKIARYREPLPGLRKES